MLSLAKVARSVTGLSTVTLGSIAAARAGFSTYYTKDHEWVKIEGGVATIGITDHAQSELGDVVYVDLPEVGASVDVGDSAAAVESVKAASDVYSPVAGTVTEINEALEENPGLVNESADTDGWFFKMDVSGDVDTSDLMDGPSYKEFAASEAH